MQRETRDSNATYQGEAVGGGGPSLDCGKRPRLQDLKPVITLENSFWEKFYT